MQYPANVRIVHVPCTGKVEVEQILAAFERGIDGVLVAGCLGGRLSLRRGEPAREAAHRGGASRCSTRSASARERLRMVNLSASEAPTFVARVREMVETVERLGPNPLRAAGEQGALEDDCRKPKADSPRSKRLLAGHDKVLFAGCGTCVTVCLAGGEREVGIMSYAMRMARRLDGRPIEIEQMTIERQCENEFIQDLAPAAERNEAILSFGCGAGVQAIAERFPEKPVYAALDTQFLGILEEQARLDGEVPRLRLLRSVAASAASAPSPAARSGCSTAPAAAPAKRAARSTPTRPCAWQLIYRRLEAIGQLDNLNEIVPPRDWRTSWQAGPRRIVREEHRI